MYINFIAYVQLVCFVRSSLTSALKCLQIHHQMILSVDGTCQRISQLISLYNYRLMISLNLCQIKPHRMHTEIQMYNGKISTQYLVSRFRSKWIYTYGMPIQEQTRSTSIDLQWLEFQCQISTRAKLIFHLGLHHYIIYQPKIKFYP